MTLWLTVYQHQEGHNITDFQLVLFDKKLHFDMYFPKGISYVFLNWDSTITLDKFNCS